MDFIWYIVITLVYGVFLYAVSRPRVPDDEEV